MKIIALTLLIASCASIKQGAYVIGEKTGNAKLMKSSSEMTPREEYYLGRSLSAQILAQNPLVKNPPLQKYVHTLGTYLSLHSSRPHTYKGYRFGVIEGSVPLALSGPDGSVFVSLGLLALLQSEDELAAVLAHEIGHVALKHAESAIQTANQLSLAGDMAALALKNKGKGVQSMGLEGYKQVTKLLLNRQFDRPQELSADAEAIRMLDLAGFDPSSLSLVLGKLQSQASFSSKHPPNRERVMALKDAKSRAHGKFARSKRYMTLVR
jgi:beta-barrel assembly-enhancing protease